MFGVLGGSMGPIGLKVWKVLLGRGREEKKERQGELGKGENT